MCTHTCLLYSFSSCPFWGYSTAAQFLPTQGSSPGVTRSTRTSMRSSPSRRPCGTLLPRVLLVYVFYASAVSDILSLINNIRNRFIISFYVICAAVYCSFCCIYVWLDPGTYMIARLMSFCKSGVTVAGLGRRTRIWSEYVAAALRSPKGIQSGSRVPEPWARQISEWPDRIWS